MDETVKVYTAYHIYLSILLKYLLKDQGYDVEMLTKVGTLPLEVDIIIIKCKPRQKHKKFNRLDFFFNLLTNYNLVEYKGPTDTLDWRDYVRLEAMGNLYRLKINHPAIKDVRLFTIASKVPIAYKKFLRSCLLSMETIAKGLYEVKGAANYRHYILELNKMTPDIQNELLLFFSSKYRSKIPQVIHDDENIMTFFLMQELYQRERQKMKLKIKDEDIVKKEFRDVISRLPLDLRLAGIKPKEILKIFSKEEILKGLRPEERLKGLHPEERLKGLRPEERVQGLELEELVSAISEEKLKKLKAILDKLNLN